MWPCTVLSADYGEIASKPGVTSAQITVRIDDGPSKGQICTYEDEVNHRSALYVMYSCKAVGWKGGKAGDDLNTLKADTDAWIKETGGRAIVEIKHIVRKTGEKAGTIWDKVNGIRRGARPLQAASAGALADAREAMRSAMKDAGTSEPPTDDVPHAAATGTDDDIPF